MEVTVTVRCVYCKKTREVGPRDVPPGGMPMCECGGVMVAESASARPAKLEE